MEKNKLLRCPFCGGRADISPVYALGGKYKGLYTVFCANVLGCSASVVGEECLDECEAKSSAIERWNRRAERMAGNGKEILL